MTEPTDVEIESAWTEATGSSILPYPDDMLAFARAVLAKWGTPAGEGEVVACGNCGGTGWMVRDPDIGTDQECFVCDGSGRYSESATPQPTKAREIERLRQDAMRYRWLRHGDNDEKVLKTYNSRPSEPGEPTMFLPRNDELDRLIDAARAARAPADSVLEDAARLDWLLLHISGAEFRRIGVHYSGNASRADVDAARKQGANHD